MRKKLFAPRMLVRYVLIVAIIALIFTVPNNLNNYQLTIMNLALIYFISVMGYIIMLGMGGMVPMSTVTFMGLAAFFTAQLSKNFGLPTLPAGILAIIGTTFIAYLLSIMLVRLEGFYFVFGTIGLCNMMATVFQNYKPLTNGADGISGIPKLVILGFTFKKLSHWGILLAFVALAVALVTSRIRNSSLGRSLMSIRDNPIAAQTLGVNVYKTKRIAFTIGSMFSALAGMLVAYHNGVVSAALFTFNVQQNLLMMAMLGGINSTIGALGGAFLVQLMPEFLRPIQEYMRLIQGMMLITLMIFMPMGVAGIVSGLWKKVKRIFLLRKGGAESEAVETAKTIGG